MHFTMKNVFAFAAVLALGVSTAAASPTQVTSVNTRTCDVINKLEKFIDSGVNVPPGYKRFDPSGVRPEAEIEIVTSDEEVLALSERYNHSIRVEAVNCELIIVTVPEDLTKAPSQHVGTLGGAYLDQTIDKIDFHLDQEELRALNGTTPADADLKAPAKCSVTWCVILWQCTHYDPNCHSCIIFWCI